MRFNLLIPAAFILAACSDISEVGRLPEFTPLQTSAETAAMMNPTQQSHSEALGQSDGASLWTSSRQSLLGDRRAMERGDIMTVVIEIDESAEMSNTSAQGRTGSTNSGLSSLFGLPQRIDANLPDGATMSNAVDANGATTFSGNGTIRRNEKLQLMVAATIVDVLPNGVLHIQGSQEVRVNFEVRELLVEGYVRPEDISRQNEITYDKIASARISYGGRGQISKMQQPRYGQQIADIILPF